MLGALVDFDKLAYLWCIRYQKVPLMLKFFRCVSHTGDGYMYVAIALFIYLHNPNTGEFFLIAGLSAFLLEIPGFITLKKLIKRDRPFVNVEGSSHAITPHDKFSLPSGHSAAAFLMATIISSFYPLFAPLAWSWACLIGLSRVMLGVHYPTDIVAGALLGCACAMIGLAFSM